MFNKAFSYTLSLLIHVTLFLIFIFYKNAKFILPSQSDGVTVNVISPQEIKRDIVIKNIVLQNNSKVEPILDAEVKLKSDKLVIKKILNNKDKVESKKSNVVSVVKEHKQKIVANDKKEYNQKIADDLLSDLNGKSIAKNIGGNRLGSGDNKVKINNYADQVINLVRPHVIIPDGVDIKLITMVKVILLPNMNVYNIKIVKSSGNLIYDNNVINAINIVKKFPNIPEGDNWLDYRVLNLTFKSE
jgi:TonB family protein